MSFVRLIKRPLNYRSIRFRLTALFLGVLAFTLILFCSLLYSAFVRSHQREFDVALYNHAVDISKSIRTNVFGELTVDSSVLSTGGKIFPFAIGKSFLQLLEMDGKILVRSDSLNLGNLPFDETDKKAVTSTGFAFNTIRADQIPSTVPKEKASYRLLSYLVRSPIGGGFVLQVAVPMTFIEVSSKGLFTLLLIGVPLTLVLATFGGLYISGRALAPVADIIERAKQLGASDLSRRLPVPATDDEIRQLALTLNDLLNRLEQAFYSQERFIADASHELKTPIAILLGEVSVLQSRPRDASEVEGFLQSARQELDYLSRVVEDLLLLARIDAGAGALVVQPVRMDEVAIEVVARLEPYAQKKSVKLRADFPAQGDFEAPGDPELLSCVIKNLIENAVKFSPEGGVVSVRLESDAEWVAVSVSDQGPGIPEEFRNKIFDRFYRVNTSGSKVAGAGLGLAITRRIVDAHKGTISVRPSREGGAHFEVRIQKVLMRL